MKTETKTIEIKPSDIDPTIVHALFNRLMAANRVEISLDEAKLLAEAFNGHGLAGLESLVIPKVLESAVFEQAKQWLSCEEQDKIDEDTDHAFKRFCDSPNAQFAKRLGALNDVQACSLLVDTQRFWLYRDSSDFSSQPPKKVLEKAFKLQGH